MAFSTIEVRWFFSGPLEETGPGIEQWFRTRPRRGGGAPPRLAWTPEPPAWRLDRYLVVTGCDDMGIKWREGRLEIKGRESALGPRAFAPGIAGVCERWIKWSYAGDRVTQRFLSLFRGNAVILVEKRRLQRLLRLSDGGGACDVGPDQPRDRGLNVELTRIRLPKRGETHWSLAFEAFPSDPELPEPFSEIVGGFLEGCPALALSAARSLSYPGWLLGLDQPGQPAN